MTRDQLLADLRRALEARGGEDAAELVREVELAAARDPRSINRLLRGQGTEIGFTRDGVNGWGYRNDAEIDETMTLLEKLLRGSAGALSSDRANRRHLRVNRVDPLISASTTA